MEFKTVPFAPAVDRANPVAGVAQELQSIISREANDGWEFVGLQNHLTDVKGTKGCFGLGAEPPYSRNFSIVVFRR